MIFGGQACTNINCLKGKECGKYPKDIVGNIIEG